MTKIPNTFFSAKIFLPLNKKSAIYADNFIPHFNVSPHSYKSV